MNLTKEKLLELNSRGIIPGPKESLEEFNQRINAISSYKKLDLFDKKKSLSWHDFDWARSTVDQLFDISPDWVQAYYSNKGLRFWQGAMIYIIMKKKPFLVLQIRKQLKNRKYLFLYEKDEILSHELAHAARMAFDEPKTEELLAYWTSTSHLRKLFGPIFRKSVESTIFMGLLGGGIFSQVLFPFYYSFLLVQIFHTSSFAMLSFCLFRLFRTRSKVNSALKKLISILYSKQKARAVLFRLTDKEIYFFARSSKAEILEYIEKLKNKELRWKVINFAYFKKIKI